MNSKGFVYVASLSSIFITAARYSASSLKDHWPEANITLFTHPRWVVQSDYLLFDQIITKDEEIVVEAHVHLVFVNKDGKPIKIPDEIYSKFKPYFCDSIKI